MTGGADIPQESTHCRKCHNDASRAHMIDIARAGRALALTPKARAKRAETQRRNMLAKWAWKPSDKPAWLTEETYKTKIQPGLVNFSLRKIAATIGVTQAYAAKIRRGVCRPHPLHWLALAKLVGIEAVRRPACPRKNTCLAAPIARCLSKDAGLPAKLPSPRRGEGAFRRESQLFSLERMTCIGS